MALLVVKASLCWLHLSHFLPQLWIPEMTFKIFSKPKKFFSSFVTLMKFFYLRAEEVGVYSEAAQDTPMDA